MERETNPQERPLSEEARSELLYLRAIQAMIKKNPEILHFEPRVSESEPNVPIEIGETLPALPVGEVARRLKMQNEGLPEAEGKWRVATDRELRHAGIQNVSEYWTGEEILQNRLGSLMSAIEGGDVWQATIQGERKALIVR